MPHSLTQNVIDKPTKSLVIIVMGVSGSGKSTLGAAIAAAMGTRGRIIPFADGDEFHTKANKDKMAAGTPLTDADRVPWLRRIREYTQRVVRESVQSSGDEGVVVACSALKKKYRDYLRFGCGFGKEEEKIVGCNLSYDVLVRTLFVCIDGPKEVLKMRIKKRRGHFMKVQMLESQLGALEDPRSEEGVVMVGMEMSTEEQVNQALQGLRDWMEE